MRRQNSRAGAEQVQTELDDLQRKYRMMEVNRKTYAEDSTNTIRMQRQQIDKLKKDNERLKEDLALETRQAKQANNQSASAQIAKLQDQADLYARKIEQEKVRIEQLDDKIKNMEKQVLKQRKDMGGVNASQENSMHVQKKIKILENRLDKALVKFNEALAHNKQLRETIDNLRRERVVFDGIYKKLERELNEKKQKMAEIIEISNAAYEARDKAQAEMIALKAAADEEQGKFEHDWSELGKLIEKDRKMRDFMKQKEREKGDTRGEESALEEEQKLRKRVNKGAWGIAKDKASIHLSMEKVQSYEEAFAKIQKATKITDIDELVQTFISAEDQNFSLFNYVNDKSNEIERLEEQIASIKKEIEKYKGQGNVGDNKRKKIIEDLANKLNATATKADKFEDRYATASKTIEALKKGIQSVYDKIGFNDEKINEILGNSGVTESNMMQYLGVIEQRVNELLQIYTITQKKDVGAEGGEAGGEGEGDNAGLAIDLPSTAQYSDGESDDDNQES
mmetsp:Transcript_25602/g.36081  ORF Transcript_25602/g.36081 Transcript_25602/m.36081 type:complete len:510 (+) Transcript_25602:33-1562(+)|eukprot:CAMPEP_0175097272 /NCGR_PEP_ID=MMETSP0086_2-20121207/5193_1 /TAXON_ID=136419 /ORGANISM="Unknown Unknown, Strain D1" /LENGTH=509 /DNA_ID=CAMNT_0016370761 /DNA_START=33 /DNA_END=1562 /DNA_ORIENTATION=+